MSERIKHGKVRRARSGRINWRGRGLRDAGPGTQAGRLAARDPREMVPAEQVAAERAVIAECCRRILGGEPLPSVVRDLDRRGLRTVTGHRWTRNGLRQMLDRPALAGLLTHNGTVIGRLAGAEPIIKAEEWERLSAILAGRPRGRPVARRAPAHQHDGVRHVRAPDAGHRAGQPSALPGRVTASAMCGAARTSTTSDAGRIPSMPPLPRRSWPRRSSGRLGDPRRADRLAARLAVVRDQRARIETEITALEAAADNLAAKTVTWGVDRVDKAMEPILNKLGKLRAGAGCAGGA